MKNYKTIKKNLIRMLILSMLPTDVFSASPETKQMIQNVLSKYCIPNDKTFCNTPREGKYDSSLSFCLCNDGMTWNDTNRTCDDCKAGTYYKQNMRDNECKKTPAGSYSKNGASNFILCSPGTYQPSSGQGSCLGCDKNNCYTSGVGATSCYYRCGGGSPYCNGYGSCVECTSDSHCSGNRTCSGGNCVCDISCSCGIDYSDCSCEYCDDDDDDDDSSDDSSSSSSGSSSGGSKHHCTSDHNSDGTCGTSKPDTSKKCYNIMTGKEYSC